MSAPAIVTLIGTFNIRPGNVGQFRANCEEMVALHNKQPGHLDSAYSFDGDSSAVSREDYDSADAVKRHMEHGERIYERTRDLVDITGVEVHGPADQLDKPRDLFADLSPRSFVSEYGCRK